MRCAFCGAELEERRITEEHWVNGDLFVIEGIPATYCPDCDEIYFADEVLDRIDALLKRKEKEFAGVRVLSVPLIPFEEAATA